MKWEDFQVNKADLINDLAKILPTKKEAEQTVNVIFNSIKESLRSYNKVTIANFGSFYVKSYSPRKVHRLKDGAKILIPPRKIVKFKPSKKILI